MRTPTPKLPHLAALAIASAAVTFVIRASIKPRRGRNTSVPQPAKPVDLMKYSGRWYELGRYENRFERDSEAVTVNYSLLPNGEVEVFNSSRQGALNGPVKSIKGRAKAVRGSDNAKLKVRFFGPFAGDYWVLDHDDDYTWSIVGEPSGRYLWLLTRAAAPSVAMRKAIHKRAGDMGYDVSLIRPTQH